jgi:hypothetical protein
MAYAAERVRSPPCLPISVDERLTKPRAFGTVLRATLERDAV